MNEETINGGLRPDKRDKRDIKIGAIYELPRLEDLPEDGMGIPKFIHIKDQKSDDTCVARSSDAVSEDQEEVELCDYFTFAIIKMIEGDPEGWGAELRSAAKAHQKYGALEKTDCPLCKTNSHNIERDRFWDNWPDKEVLLQLALKHKKASYFLVEGSYNKFDVIRATLWMCRLQKRSAFTGANWKNIWTYAKEGVIPKFDLEKGQFGHAFKIFDWKKIDGEIYLMAQLSNGTLIGNQGVFYFPRSVVNKEFFNAFTFLDMPAEEAKQRGWDWKIKTRERIKWYFNEICK